MEVVGFIFCVLLIIIAAYFVSPKEENSHDYDNFSPKKKETYKDVLNDERWKAKRAEIIKRDNNECQWCHTHGTPNNPLQVHHKWYQMKNGKFINPWDYKDSCYITLCRRCHEFAHKKRKPPIYHK